MSNKGNFIVFEGIDGSGTTTQIKRVSEELRRKNRLVTTTAEPSNGPVGKLIRKYLGGSFPMPTARIRSSFMSLLFTADRLEHFNVEIEPALQRGDMVLCDRYLLSTIAYQTKGLDKQQWISTISTDVVQPDFHVYIRLDPKVAIDRVEKRGGNREFYETLQIQKGTHQNYEELFKSIPRSQVLIVDGTDTPESITQMIVSEIERRFFS